MQLDNIALEVLRHQLDAICGEGAATIKRTAVSPLVVEGGDYSCTLLDGKGLLVTGGGHIAYHFYAATNAIAGVFTEHGDDIQDGDVFLANDPHRGGGLHAQDVFIMRPVFAEERLVAWMANSAHVVDVGGMQPGSFAPSATDCFSEAIRLPAVKITAAGVERRDPWNILLNNVRMPHLVEMDIRGLAAGVDVGAAKLQQLADQIGVDALQKGFDELNRRTEAAVRREIALIEDGVYRSTSWAEWNDERFRIPCTTTVDGDSIRFDFTGTAPQTTHFFNSKEYIVKGKIGVELQRFIGRDVPLNQGFYEALEVHCPVGSLLNCTHPAPVGAAHIIASHDASEAAQRTFHQAVAASPASLSRPFLSSSQTMSANQVVTFSGQGLTGATDSWIMIDGTAVGSPAGNDRDGTDFNFYLVGQQAAIQTNDVEVSESWYPLRFEYRRRSSGVSGAGRYRGGCGVDLAFTVDGSPHVSGAAIGGHGQIPLPGTAGGSPGRGTSIELHGPEGEVTPIGTLTQGFSLPEGHSFAVKAAGGGGWGDPLDREVAAVLNDVETGLISADEARAVYGVDVSDGTTSHRTALLQERLATARAAATEPGQVDAEQLASSPALPIAPGVDQRGGVAVSARSGAVLAHAPAHWTDGCPVLVEAVADGVETRSYLDPATGHILHTEVALAGEPRSFESSPLRWSTWNR
ncbi:hydantoinase B/oxoprolinase family protein [Geodermatophilus sabuli]|uniref:N-methylhydantoinase B n=1 Tax=Geodermatophilus sabuli TaxID=1564158 RepID=A0A285EAH5_9ACTN|nr:hydantoinase B/oxoprolinase family protein [Geodermatophilus sabuli]MBB3085533.1 N-methylhydantoinase B [Geodermatophilus sabuli]SNX96045.1 N-methylhydantoinase B [Geodermatophilus sabuli]